MSIEELCCSMVGHEAPFIFEEKDIISVAFGYFPARLSTELYDTHGLHPLDTIGPLREKGLRVDWRGFQLEMARKGADVSGMVQEGLREQGLIEKGSYGVNKRT